LIELFEPIRTGDGVVVVVLAAVEPGRRGVEGRARAGAGVIVCSYELERQCGGASRVGTGEAKNSEGRHGHGASLAGRG
jgi:hypothetical protein